jgi:hypothetical protein
MKKETKDEEEQSKKSNAKVSYTRCLEIRAYNIEK